MPDEADPPRKNYGFKDREFKRDNALQSTEPPPPTAKELAMLAGPAAKHGKALTGTQKVDDPNDVYAVLQGNRAVEKQHHLDEFELKQIKNRRKRDYWLLMLTVQTGLGTLAYLGRGNPFVLACSVAAMGLIALGLTWIMWQVMSKY